jgi:hypothetical protein
MSLPMRTAALIALAAHVVLAHASDGNGLTVRGDELQWPRWQGRLSMSSASPAAVRSFGQGSTGISSLSLMSDYYLTGSLLGPKQAGGFRATSGVLIGPRSQAWTALSASSTGGGFSIDRRTSALVPGAMPGDPSADQPTLPYVGVGYTGLSPRGGWSFNADLGVVSLSASSAVKFGRGTQSLDDAIRDMRWSPVLQLGVSYSF